jgi:predicted NAD/FAD-binding protein
METETSNPLKIAVIGAGVAGLTAAYLLHRRHDVTLFERNDYVGGHTHTIVLDSGPDAGTPVDTGFIVMNHRNYPLLTRLFAELKIELRDSEMSFGYYNEASGLQYCGSSLNGLFAQRRNLFRPAFHQMIADILRFYRRAEADLAANGFRGRTLGQYLADGGFGRMFREDHILPMGAAIWSTPCGRMLDFPAESFVRFFHNHGLLSVNDRPQWRTVAGGSHRYVQALLKTFARPVRLNCPVTEIRRADGQIIVATAAGAERFDRAVVAAHADEALAMLADANEMERRLLGAWVYENNRTVLHRDASVMPPNRRAWSSWNYVREQAAPDGGKVSLTYHMNRLQGLRTTNPLFVTLNRARPYPAGTIIRELEYTHPSYAAAALASQRELHALNGARGTYFCGSYFGYGFHEDAVRSAVQVAQHFGIPFG